MDHSGYLFDCRGVVVSQTFGYEESFFDVEFGDAFGAEQIAGHFADYWPEFLVWDKQFLGVLEVLFDNAFYFLCQEIGISGWSLVAGFQFSDVEK